MHPRTLSVGLAFSLIILPLFSRKSKNFFVSKTAKNHQLTANFKQFYPQCAWIVEEMAHPPGEEHDIAWL